MSCDVAAREDLASLLERNETFETLSASARPVAPLVSVIVPVFNDAEHLAVCLDALSQQNWPSEEYEIIVVDNGSVDGSDEVALRFPNVQLVRESKPGSYAARNRGISVARGELFAFTDSDCIPNPNWLRAGINFLEQNPDCALIGGPVTIVPQDSARLSLAEFHQNILAFDQLRYINEHRFTITANMMARRWLFEEVGHFHSEFRSNGDREWCLRAGAAGHPPRYEEGFRIGHHARRTLGQLLQKSLRLAGGKVQLARLNDTPLKELILWRVSGAWSTSRRIWRNPVNRSLELRTKLVLAEWWMSLLSVGETIRVWCGGTPRRR